MLLHRAAPECEVTSAAHEGVFVSLRTVAYSAAMFNSVVSTVARMQLSTCFSIFTWDF